MTPGCKDIWQKPFHKIRQQAVGMTPSAVIWASILDIEAGPGVGCALQFMAPPEN